MVEIFLDRTPFYAESGGQIGDTGTITTETGTAEVLDTTFALPGLRRHTARITAGTISAGQTATAAIDADRRNAIRKNHTGTHVLHWALRKVLGEHVKQAGSWVGPDRLRFDFSHYAAVTPDEIEEIERLANGETLANAPVRAFETTKDEAESLGAIAFFGDKYGDIVRVLEAGSSVELCGGTHVRATGDIGTIKVVSEASIGSNLRRIEAVTGANSVALFQEYERDDRRRRRAPRRHTFHRQGERREADRPDQGARGREQGRCARQLAVGRAGELAAAAPDGVVVARVDDLTPADLRDLAVAVRQQAGVRRVVLAGTTTTGGVSLVAAVQPVGGHRRGRSRSGTRPRRSVGAAAARATSRRPAARTRRARRRAAPGAARQRTPEPVPRARRRPRFEADRDRRQRPVRHDRVTAHGRPPFARRAAVTSTRSPGSPTTKTSS